MTWFKVDDKLHEHRKAARAGKAAMGVWVLAGSWSSDNGQGGFVPERVLSRWGTRKDAVRLVDAGLWNPGTKGDEEGWWFHEWDLRNPDEASAKAIKDAEKVGGSLGNHRRWHVKRKVVAEDCPHCEADQGRIGVPDRGGESPPNPPDPTRPVSLVTYVEPSSKQGIGLVGLEGHELQKIALLTGGDMKHAEKVAAHVLSTANGPVRSPLRYVMTAVRKDPDAHRYRRGNPTKATACPQHPGEWADNCRIHASEGSA